MRNLMIVAITTILMTGLVSSSPYLFAEKPDSNYGGSRNCTDNLPSGQDSKTCCWRERIPGKILGETYCQTCKWVAGEGFVDCSQKELQMLEQPPNPPPSSSSGPSAPIQDDGVLEQPGTPNKGSVMNLPNNNERSLDSQ